MKKYKNLMAPISIGKVLIKNRIAMAPMGDLQQFWDPLDGTVNKRWIDYFVERAKGGVGLIITGVLKVEDDITKFRQNGRVTWPLVSKKSMQDYAELMNYARTFGARVFIQLTAGPGRVLSGTAIDEGYAPISASANAAYFRPHVTCRALSTVEVDGIVAAFGRSAVLLREAGIDGIEVHGHEGYLIDQFATSLWNKRTDKYGGDLEGRASFAIEILKTIKREAGEHFPVIYRYGSKHFIKGPWQSALNLGEEELGRDIEESIELAKILEREGYDGLHVDTGCYESSYWAHPPIYFAPGFSADLTAKVKNAVSIPVIAVGRLGDPEVAEKIVADGKSDLIALGRELLSDPYWPIKLFASREDEIRHCIGCHECIYRAEMGKYLSCTVNPICGNEGIVRISPALRKKRIVIIGGGIAGMEAARIAAIRGHDVSLFEQKGELGGHVIAGSIPEFKKDISLLLEWYRKEMKKMRIDTRLNAIMTIDNIKKENPDIVVAATGSIPKIPVFTGEGKQNVVHCIDVLLSKKEIGKKVLVIGGGVLGCETALWMAQKGKQVTIVEMLPDFARDIHRSNRAMLLDLLKQQNVRLLPNSKVISIEKNVAMTIDKNLDSALISCDTFVLALGLVPDDRLFRSLLASGYEAYAIGDCIKPRKIYDAVWEANMLAISF